MRPLTHLAVLVLLSAAAVTPAATLPSNFAEVQIATGLDPSAMEFAPDGRLFVCEKVGRLRVIKNDALLATPFVDISAQVDNTNERGLLGIAFDPGFATNHWLYVYYTAKAPAVHNRVSRFTANGDVAVAGSETVILDLTNLSSAGNHNGGAIHFGTDGKLYIAAGENANGANAQSMDNLLGKLLRLNADGSIPSDNPFYATATGSNRAIWALGLRNPFTFAVQPGTGRIFINDVGNSSREEIDDGIAGSNYGWPTTEGPTTDSRFRSPLYSYSHSVGIAICGGAFYNPPTAQFPSSYVGKYFFSDYGSNSNGWIKLLDPATATATDFATGVARPVDLKVSSDGSLYYLARAGLGGGSVSDNTSSSNGSVVRVRWTGSQAPSISLQPHDATVAAGATATFTVAASGTAPFTYAWQRAAAGSSTWSAISGASAASYTTPATVVADNGARFRCVVGNGFGTATSNAATLTVTSNTAPTPTITTPATGSTYGGGTVIAFSGSASDAEDGTVAASGFSWSVLLHHQQHTHPALGPLTGVTAGSFTAPVSGETDPLQWYEIILTVTDSGGLSTTVTRRVDPRTQTFTLATTPTGLQVTLDGQPQATPVTITGVVGMSRSLGVTSPQSVGSASYGFTRWSDGGTTTHTIATPASATTYTATFAPLGSGTGLAATYFDNADLTGTTVERTDATVDFTWGTGAPASGIGADTFSVRWTGEVQAQFSETYTFSVRSDDGARLRVNGQLLVDKWVNQGPTEWSGTIALSAGQRVPIAFEYFDNTGGAEAHLSWSSASTLKTIIPTSQLYPTTAPPPGVAVHINFQPPAAPAYNGYLVDGGAAFADRGNGWSYGWTTGANSESRDRNASVSPDQRYDTLIHMQKSSSPDARWEIALPDGDYDVTVVSGDASYTDSVFKVQVEGVLVVDGTPTSSAHWITGNKRVTVSDGRLTLSNGSGAANNKVCWIDIVSAPALVAPQAGG